MPPYVRFTLSMPYMGDVAYTPVCPLMGVCEALWRGAHYVRYVLCTLWNVHFALIITLCDEIR